MQQSNTQDVTIFYDHELNSDLTQKHKEGIAKAKELAKLHLLNHKPPVKGGNLNLFIAPIHAFYTALLGMVNDKIQSRLHFQFGNAEKTKSEDTQKLLQKELIEKESHLKSLDKPTEPDINRAKVMKRYYGAILIMLAIAGAEIVYLSRSLQVLSGSLLGAILLGLGVTASIAVIGHYGFVFAEKIFKNKNHVRLAKLGIVLIVLITFTGLGILRKQFLDATSGEDSSVVVFVAINLVMYLSAMMISEMVLHPVAAQKRELDAYQTKKKRYDLEVQKVLDLKAQIETEKHNLDAYLRERLKVLSWHKATERKINAMYIESVSQYVQVIITEREGDTPECITNELESLTLHTEMEVSA